MLKVKVMINGRETFLAMCDEELLGKRFAAGKRVLDLDKYRGFYEGESFNEREESAQKQIETYLKSATSVNVVGKRSMALLKKLGYDTETAAEIQNVPHLQIYSL